MQQQHETLFFDPDRWAIVPASDYANGPSHGNACHTLKEALHIFQAELPARMSNAMRRQRELEDLRSFIAGTRSAIVLRQTTAVTAVQNEVATLIGVLREYEQRMISTIKQQCHEFQASLHERSLLVEDTGKKLASSISKMSTEDAIGNEAVTNALNPSQMEAILSGMITADHLIEESAALFSNFPNDVAFHVERMKDAMTLTPKLVTLNVERAQLKGVPPLIITKDIAVANASGGGADGGDGSSSSPNKSRSVTGGGGDTGIRRLLQLPGSEHVQGLYPRTAFGQALTKRPFASVHEFHKLLHAGCIRSLGAQLGAVAANRTEFLNPFTDAPLRAGRDTFRVFAVCTAPTAEGSTRCFAQNALHLPKELPPPASESPSSSSSSFVKLDSFRSINQNFAVLWFDFGATASVRVDRYVLFHGHEAQHCALRNWRLLGTNDMPVPPGIVAVAEDDTLLKIARDSRAAVGERHRKAQTPDAALPERCNVTVLDVRSREAALGVAPYGGVMFECCGANPDSNNNSNNGGSGSDAGAGATTSPRKSGGANSPTTAAATATAAAGGSNSPRSLQHSSPAARQQQHFFRYIGIQVTAPGAGGGFHIELAGVEFFGTIMTLGGQ